MRSEIRRVNLFVFFLIILTPLSDFLLDNLVEKKSILYIKEIAIVFFLAILLILFNSKKITPQNVSKLSIYTMFINIYITVGIGYQTNIWGENFEPVFLKIQIVIMLLMMAVGVLFNFKHLLYINIMNMLFIICCLIWNVANYPIEKYFFFFILISGISIVGYYLHIELVQFEKRLEKERHYRILADDSFALQSDYNNLVRQNSRLQKSQKILRRNNVVRDKILSIIIHEVKSPLYYLVMKLGILQKRKVTMDQMINDIREIEKASFHTYNTVERISEWIQLYKPGQAQLIDIVLINDGIDLVLKNYELQITEKKISVNNLISDNLFAKVNETMLLLVLNNLIGNAIKYTEEGEIKLTSRISAEYVTICIQDTGIGMSDSQLKQFSETTMISNTKGSREELGLGIGLYLISEIIHDMGGEFTLGHNQPSGVSAILSLPYSE